VIESQINRRRTVFTCLLLVFATLSVYWPVRHYDFVDYDDDKYVYENQDVRAGLTWQGFASAWIVPVGGNWHPVTMLSHMTDCQFFGLNPGAHHLVNVAFHCANAVLLLLLLESATGAFWRSAFVAALFALHPLRVESVAWVSERKDVLGGFFFLLALWMYVLHTKEADWANPGESGGRRKRFYSLSLAFFVSGLLAKPMVVTLPLVMLFMDYWPLERMMDRDKPDFRLANLRSLLVEKWPFFLFALMICPLTFLTQNPALFARNGDDSLHAGQVVMNYFSYVETLIWPHNLSFLYARPPMIPLASLLPAALVLLLISGLAVAGWRRRPYFVTGWLWFLNMLLPISGIVPLGGLSTADRYTYLPSIGFYLAVTWAAAAFGQKFLSAAPQRIFGAAGAALVLSVCALLTRQQLACWQNSQTLMEHALKIDPDNSVAQIDLRVYRFEKAQSDVRKGNPSKPPAK
jgi:hypothetical protein